MFIKAVVWGSESEPFRQASDGQVFVDWQRGGWEGKLKIDPGSHDFQQAAGITDLYFGGFSKYVLSVIEGQKRILELGSRGERAEVDREKGKQEERIDKAMRYHHLAADSLKQIIDEVQTYVYSAQQDIDSTHRLARTRLLAYSLSVIALSLVGGVFFARREIIRPLARLQKGIEVIGEGNFDYRVDMDAKDEIGRLATSLDRMTQRLADSQEELRREAAERKRAEQLVLEQKRALERANEGLEQRNAELDQFTYVASHDLQEPLRKLASFSTLLSKDLGGDLPERAQMDLNFIQDAAKRMQSLVQDLLAFSRSGRTALKWGETSLDACVDAALEALDARIQETHAEIQRDELPTVWADSSMLTQLLQNLIGNAVKFVREDTPSVRITAEEAEGGLILGVQDNGIGISENYAEQIFHPFKRLHGRGEYEGTGIGLAICRKVVELHHGKIWVESEAGQGAHFRFTLPVSEESSG